MHPAKRGDELLLGLLSPFETHCPELRDQPAVTPGVALDIPSNVNAAVEYVNAIPKDCPDGLALGIVSVTHKRVYPGNEREMNVKNQMNVSVVRFRTIPQPTACVAFDAS